MRAFVQRSLVALVGSCSMRSVLPPDSPEVSPGVLLGGWLSFAGDYF